MVNAETPKPIVAVTGASRGIGHAIVKEFHKSGWEVFTLARTPFSKVCPWAEGIVRHIEVDLARPESVAEACAQLQEALGEGGAVAAGSLFGIFLRWPRVERDLHFSRRSGELCFHVEENPL